MSHIPFHALPALTFFSPANNFNPTNPHHTVMFWTVVLSIVLLYIVRHALQFLRYRALARATGLPYLIFPWSELNLVYQTVAETRLFPYVVNHWLPPGLADYINASIFRFRWNVKDRMRKRFGGVYLVVTSSTLTCNVDDAAVASQICMARHSFPKPVEKYDALAIYGPNVVTTEKSQWAHHRRHTASSFNERNDVLVWQESIRQTTEMLEYLASSRSEFVVGAVRENSLKLTLQVLCGAGFGVNLPFKPMAETTGEGDVENLFQDSHSPPSSYHYTFRSVMEYAGWHPRSMLIANRLLPKWLPRGLLPFYQADFNAYNDLGRYLRALVVKPGNPTAKEHHNLLEGIVGGERQEANKRQESTSQDVSQKGLSVEEILGNLYIFIIAGHETTATTFRYAIVLLALHQDIQDQLWKGIQEATRDEPEDPAQWDYGRVFPKLVAPLCVMLETLRLYPPVVTVPKWTANSVASITYQNQDYRLPPRTFVNLNTTGLHYAEEYWGPDADAFHPWRWDRRNHDSKLAENDGVEGLSAPGLEHGTIHKPTRGAFIAFSDGVRACLGKKFAQVEFVVAITVVFRDYRVGLAPKSPQETAEEARKRARCALQRNSAFLTLGMQDEVPVLFRKRVLGQ